MYKPALIASALAIVLTAPQVSATTANTNTSTKWAVLDSDDQITKVSAIPNDLRTYMTGRSWKKGCPVSLDGLSLVAFRYNSLNTKSPGTRSIGTVVVARSVSTAIANTLATLYKSGFAIDKAQLVDDFNANDDRSTLANNTSGFNCRRSTGSKTWSKHAYGKAIDINPVQNPYVRKDGSLLDPNAKPYLDRAKNSPGMIVSGDQSVAEFEKIGWTWGGNWDLPTDYQHFQTN